MGRSRLAIVTVAAFVAGVGLMVPFEHTLTRVAGVACLLAFIASGVFLIANPDDLSRPDDEER